MLHAGACRCGVDLERCARAESRLSSVAVNDDRRIPDIDVRLLDDAMVKKESSTAREMEDYFADRPGDDDKMNRQCSQEAKVKQASSPLLLSCRTGIMPCAIEIIVFARAYRLASGPGYALCLQRTRANACEP